MKVLIAGCGWLGRALGRALVQDGHDVVGVRRDPAACHGLLALGIRPLVLDLTAPGALGRLPPDAGAVIACQAAGGRDAETYRRTYLQATAPLLELARRNRQLRLVWIGSTGVFGQTDGSEVDERTPPLPVGPTSAVLVEAERRVLDAAVEDGLSACVLRLSGLYGPERYGVLDRVRDGRLGLGPGDDGWMNWCHRDDAVRAIRALIDGGQRGRVYHASDAEPTRRRDVVRWIGERLGLDPPLVQRGAASDSERANRRVSARVTRQELGLTLAYPSFRDGLEPGIPG